MSNGISILTEIRRKNLTPRVSPYKATQGDRKFGTYRDRSATYRTYPGTYRYRTYTYPVSDPW